MASNRPQCATLDVLAQWLEGASGDEILDIGCGTGAVAAALAKRGFRVCGIEPQVDLIDAARKAYPDVTFAAGDALRLPYEPGRFRHAYMMNALHHLPEADMLPALEAAFRVVRERVVVIEPLAEGPFFEVMRIVDDETEVRGLAQDALSRGVAAGLFKLESVFEWDDVRRYPTIAAFTERIIAADPERRGAVAARVDELSRAASRYRTGGWLVLPQPHRAQILRK